MRTVREGVGVHRSLMWVTQRFAQRALEDFYRNERREFLIDAGTTVEFAAKALIAQHEAVILYRDEERERLTEHHRILLNPDGPTGIAALNPRERDDALKSLLKLRTIDAAIAIRSARRYCEFSRAAARRVLAARNRAVHLGDADYDELDDIARDFLSTALALWTSTGHSEPELWGDLSPIATTNHLRRSRTPIDEATVRVVLARRRWNVALVDHARRSRDDLC